MFFLQITWAEVSLFDDSEECVSDDLFGSLDDVSFNEAEIFTYSFQSFKTAADLRGALRLLQKDRWFPWNPETDPKWAKVWHLHSGASSTRFRSVVSSACSRCTAVHGPKWSNILRLIIWSRPATLHRWKWSDLQNLPFSGMHDIAWRCINSTAQVGLLSSIWCPSRAFDRRGLLLSYEACGEWRYKCNSTQ